MPIRAPRPCPTHRCPNLAGECTAHPAPGRSKDPAQAAFYGSTLWKRLRAQVRAEEPFCRLCGILPTASVDHEDGDWTNNRRENLRGLCSKCEPRRTGRQHQRKALGRNA